MWSVGRFIAGSGKALAIDKRFQRDPVAYWVFNLPITAEGPAPESARQMRHRSGRIRIALSANAAAAALMRTPPMNASRARHSRPPIKPCRPAAVPLPSSPYWRCRSRRSSPDMKPPERCGAPCARPGPYDFPTVRAQSRGFHRRDRPFQIQLRSTMRFVGVWRFSTDRSDPLLHLH